MARTKEFDVDQALDRAVETFWLHGYDGTSMQMLLDAMQIGRQSLYDTFGGKRELFVAALERYDRSVGEHVLAPLRASGGGLDAIRGHFANAIERMTAERPCRACLVVNATMELAAQDPDIALALGRSLDQLRAAFGDAVATGQAAGDISDRHSSDTWARFLTDVGLGLTVSAKAGATPEQLRATVDVALAAIT